MTKDPNFSKKQRDCAENLAGMVAHLPNSIASFAEARRMREAIDVALALLDEMFELGSREDHQAVAWDIADIFHEISQIAASGESAARKTLENEDNVGKPR